MGALRARILRAGGRENTLFSSVQLVSGTLFAAAILLVGGIELAIVRGAEVLPNGTIDVEGTRVLLTLGASASQIMALRMGAVFIAISTSRAARAGLFPRWFALMSLILATALLLVATKWHAVVLAIPLWVAATSVVVLSQRHNRPVPVDV
jgi:hypothetical protein